MGEATERGDDASRGDNVSRLRNRIRKADYFTDGELLRWPRDKRTTYSGLWAIAEDSGCLEDDPFEWKVSLWPSPLDDDLTVTVLQQWRDELVRAGKLVRYEARGKRLLFIRTFHTHEHPRNPQSPTLPLPAWVVHDQIEPKRGDTTVKRNAYRVVTSLLPPQNDDSTVTVTSPLSCPVPSSPIPSLSTLSDSDESNDIPPDDFDLFWTPYPRKESKQAARRSWKRVPKKDRAAATAAADSMRDCVDRGWQEKTFCPHPSTFLNQRRWEDWADGPPANYLPDEAKGGNGKGPALVKRPTCPKCETDLTYDDRQRATCPMCDYREVTP